MTSGHVFYFLSSHMRSLFGHKTRSSTSGFFFDRLHISREARLLSTDWQTVSSRQPIGPPSPRHGPSRLRQQRSESAAARDAKREWWRWRERRQTAGLKPCDRDAQTAAELPAAPPSRRTCRRSELVHWNLQEWEIKLLKVNLNPSEKSCESRNTDNLTWNRDAVIQRRRPRHPDMVQVWAVFLNIQLSLTHSSSWVPQVRNYRMSTGGQPDHSAARRVGGPCWGVRPPGDRFRWRGRGRTELRGGGRPSVCDVEAPVTTGGEENVVTHKV